MYFYVHIFESINNLQLAIVCSKINFKYAYKHVTSTDTPIFYLNHLHVIEMGSVFIHLCHNEIKIQPYIRVNLPWVFNFCKYANKVT